MIHLQVWCQVFEAASWRISGCVFSTKEVSPKQMRMTRWPLVGNEEMKPVTWFSMAFRFPHSLLRATQMKQNETPNSPRHTPRWPGINAFATIHILDIGSWVQKKLNKWKSLKKWGLMKLTILFCTWNNNSHQSGNNESIEPKQKRNLQ